MFNLEIFDKFTEKVYITDLQTDEIIFINRPLRRTLGIERLEDVTGKKCYKVLQGKDSKCEFCTNHLLRENHFYEWKTHNELLQMDYFIQDTIIDLSGRKCRLEIVHDIVENDDMDNLELFYEKLGNEVLGIALKEENIDEGIQKSIGLLGRKMNADRIYIFENHGEFASNTYEWCAQGVSAEKDNLQDIPLELLSPWYDMFDTMGEVVIEDLEDIKEEYGYIYDILKPQNINTLVAQPICINKKVIGFFGVDNVDRRIMGEISSFMKMIGAYTSELIEKRNNRHYMEKMSKFDGLTNLYNRKMAENMINDSLSVCGGTMLILDLDKFKLVNDLFGHQRGDELLKDVGQNLRAVSRATDIAFRLGGDEFGLFFPTLISEKAIVRKCEELLRSLRITVEDETNHVDVSASIGVAVAGEEGENFMKLYQKADKALYKAKENGKNCYDICTENA